MGEDSWIRFGVVGCAEQSNKLIILFQLGKKELINQSNTCPSLNP